MKLDVLEIHQDFFDNIVGFSNMGPLHRQLFPSILNSSRSTRKTDLKRTKVDEDRSAPGGQVALFLRPRSCYLKVQDPQKPTSKNKKQSDTFLLITSYRATQDPDGYQEGKLLAQ